MLAEKKICCGCGLCKFVCRNHAITMIRDNEGFYYPQIDEEKCIHCGKCSMLCPVLNNAHIVQKNEIERKQAYAGYSENLDILLKSSSGGAAYTMAQFFIKQGGIVFGVAYDDDYRGASYIMVEDLEGLPRLQESKYVESKRDVLFDKIGSVLDAGYKVLVIGLPCDIAAVKSLVGENRNLYTCKLCCRSNTSNKALEQFIAELERKFKSSVAKISLRYKEKGMPRFPTKCRVEFVNGEEFISDFVKTDYGKAFQILARPSCLNCKAKTIEGLADVTIGDFQGANPQSEYYNTNGLSLIVVHNAKGDELRKLLREFYLKEMPYDDVVSYNWMVNKSIPKSPVRDQFSCDFMEHGLETACLRLVKKQNEKIDQIANEMIKRQYRVIIWGAGDTAENLYDRFRIDQWNLKYIFDSSRLKIGNMFKGMEILDLKLLPVYRNQADVLIVMIPSENEEKLNEILSKIGWKKPVIHAGKYKFFRG